MGTPPTVDELQYSGSYQLRERLAFDRIVPFIWRWYAQRASWITILHFVMTLIPSVWLAAVLLRGTGGSSRMADLALGLAGFIAVLPAHELIHAAAFRLAGVKDIRFGFTLKEMTFYTIAHRSPLSQPAFPLAALAPSLILTPLLLWAAITPGLRIPGLTLLALHTSAAIGDIALVNYFYLNRGRRLWTYDDADLRETYIYAEREDE